MATRKLWATRYARINSEMKRHESKAAVYRYVENERANWEAGALRSQWLTVYVDFRDGYTWRNYEQIDLSELVRPADSEGADR